MRDLVTTQRYIPGKSSSFSTRKNSILNTSHAHPAKPLTAAYSCVERILLCEFPKPHVMTGRHAAWPLISWPGGMTGTFLWFCFVVAESLFHSLLTTARSWMDGASTCASCLAALPVPEAAAGKTDPHAPNVRKLKIFLQHIADLVEYIRDGE